MHNRVSDRLAPGGGRYGKHLLAVLSAMALLATVPATATAALGSDEFNVPALDTTVWSFVDPVGDSKLTMNGTEAVISVPAGSTHDLWTGKDQAPRLSQPAANVDFEVELRFASAVTQAYQLQGLVVEEDSRNLVRVELNHDGKGPKVYVATRVEGTSTTRHWTAVSPDARYLRVRRSGSTWTVRVSTDGVAWTTAVVFEHAMTMRKLGPFAGNVGWPAPAHSARVDYFRVLSEGAVADTAPPAVGNVAAAPGATSAAVSWTTDEPADSRVEYGTTTAYGQSRSDAALTANHSLSLTGLACETTYHYRVSSADAAGNRTTSTNRSFSTGACSSGGGAGDEFDGAGLDTSVWRLYDPVGDASVSVASGQLRLGVPAGVSHDLWTNALRAPRVLHAAANGNFEIEAKYDTAAAETTQSQGLVAQADDDDLVRFDVYYASGTTRVFAATFTNGQATSRARQTIQGTAPLYLRMRRIGSTWTLRYSHTGTSWATAASFDHTLALTEYGVFVINAGSPAPAFTSHVDHFRQIPLDQPPPPDSTPPAVGNVAAAPGATSAAVSWTTDEPADSRVEYGTTTAYGQSRSDAALTANHSLSLTGLACETTYHYRVSSADAAGNRTTSTNRSFTTGGCAPPGGPQITVWYGDSQPFGEIGFPQRWLNVVGRADDQDGVSKLEYRLDGGQLRSLVIDPAINHRIDEFGDFNVQLDRGAITPGQHVLTLIATDSIGAQTTRSVALQVGSQKTWPLPYETNWASGLQSTAQVVDGLWTPAGDGVRTVEPGYDRTIALGAESWPGIDVTVPVTIHSLDWNAPHSGVGVATGWRGHEGGGTLPYEGWPLGGFCFYYRNGATAGHELYLFWYGWPPYESDNVKDWIQLGTPYMFRMKTEPLDAQNSRYSCKVWRASDPEPTNWGVSQVMARRDGSVLLVADYADVTFGRVRVTP